MQKTDVSTLKINRMSKSRYEQMALDGEINENELYLTPDDTVEVPTPQSGDTGKFLGVGADIQPKWIEIPAPEKELPTVTAADAGKFLRVNASGAWTAQNVPAAEDNTF